MTDQNQRVYGADEIQVLEGLDPVRLRPGMYIGSTGERGLHHLVYEIVDNSIDEALAGCCGEISVVIYEDGSVSVADDGSGIPVEIHKQTGKSTLETVLTILHAGGKFDNQAYKVSGGLHGVGISVVNALSERLVATVQREGKIYQQEFSKGEVVSDLEIVGETGETGTLIKFKPDPEIFDTVEFSYKTLKERLRQMAFLTKGIVINLEDQRTGEKESFYYEGGIKEYVAFLNESREPIHEDIIYIEGEQEDMYVELAIQYTTSYDENVTTFANNIATTEGGAHLSGLRTALTKSVNDYARKYNLIKENEDNFLGEDVREGVTAILSVKLPNPQFEGQTKTKLGNTEARYIVESFTSNRLENYLEENPKTAKDIIKKIEASQQARIAARKARDLTRKRSIFDSMALPGKLTDCQSNNIDETEIFLVEGDSAGGSAKTGRDRRFQAILPLRGKILNVEKATIDRILNTQEIQSMVTAFGTGIGPDFDISKLRYGKIIIMTDADVDGAHIRTLLLTFFYRYLPELIEHGHVYIAQPPLYGIKRGSKVVRYVYDDMELQAALDELGRDKHKIQRYKGLGEMNDDQLWETTMDPENRVLLRVNVDENSKTTDEIFSILMGDEVEPRREFIERNAKYVENIDA